MARIAGLLGLLSAVGVTSPSGQPALTLTLVTFTFGPPWARVSAGLGGFVTTSLALVPPGPRGRYCSTAGVASPGSLRAEPRPDICSYLNGRRQ